MAVATVNILLLRHGNTIVELCIVTNVVLCTTVLPRPFKSSGNNRGPCYNCIVQFWASFKNCLKMALSLFFKIFSFLFFLFKSSTTSFRLALKSYQSPELRWFEIWRWVVWLKSHAKLKIYRNKFHLALPWLLVIEKILSIS